MAFENICCGIFIDDFFKAIEGYRETERSKWNEQNAAVISRVKHTAFSETTELLPHVHILDLAAAGHIRPHVDAVRVSRNLVISIFISENV